MLSFPGEQGDAELEADLLQGPIGPHQLGGLVFSIRIFLRVILNAGPAEIIHPADLLQVAPHHQEPADRLIDGGGHHGIGVDRPSRWAGGTG